MLSVWFLCDTCVILGRIGGQTVWTAVHQLLPSNRLVVNRKVSVTIRRCPVDLPCDALWPAFHGYLRLCRRHGYRLNPFKWFFCLQAVQLVWWSNRLIVTQLTIAYRSLALPSRSKWSNWSWSHWPTVTKMWWSRRARQCSVEAPYWTWVSSEVFVLWNFFRSWKALQSSRTLSL